MHHILLVDDDLNFRRSLVIQLEFEGHKVTAVESAYHAFAYLKRQHSSHNNPDIVITDVRMPEIEGAEFVMRLREQYRNIPVLVISAFDLPEELVGYPFLRKPFKIQEMVEIVDKLIRNHTPE